MNQEHAVGLEILRISTLMRRYADNSAELRQSYNITGSNGWILAFLYEHEGEDVYQKDLEEAFSVTRSTVSKVVKLMESKGLIRRESVFHDARLKKLILTDKGREVHQLAAKGNEQLEIRLEKGFSPMEKEQLLSFLRRVTENLENS